MAVALPGTAVMVRAGTYVERVDITHGGRDALPIWLISADGQGAARVESSSTCNGLQSSAARPDFIARIRSTFSETGAVVEPEFSETQPALCETDLQSSGSARNT